MANIDPEVLGMRKKRDVSALENIIDSQLDAVSNKRICDAKDYICTPSDFSDILKAYKESISANQLKTKTMEASLKLSDLPINLKDTTDDDAIGFIEFLDELYVRPNVPNKDAEFSPLYHLLMSAYKKKYKLVDSSIEFALIEAAMTLLLAHKHKAPTALIKLDKLAISLKAIVVAPVKMNNFFTKKKVTKVEEIDEVDSQELKEFTDLWKSFKKPEDKVTKIWELLSPFLNLTSVLGKYSTQDDIVIINAEACSTRRSEGDVSISVPNTGTKIQFAKPVPVRVQSTGEGKTQINHVVSDDKTRILASVTKQLPSFEGEGKKSFKIPDSFLCGIQQSALEVLPYDELTKNNDFKTNKILSYSPTCIGTISSIILYRPEFIEYTQAAESRPKAYLDVLDNNQKIICINVKASDAIDEHRLIKY